MSQPAVSVEDLSKWYQLGPKGYRYGTLAEVIAKAATAPIRRLTQGRGAAREQGTVWALNGVSFQAGTGDVVGIIGRNGAGKSTLLKILSRITEPTSGRIRLQGRGGSLLEVGTGFHPDLTGRENVYLNATILGMKRRELERQFDAIVEFSGVERFLDTPVKRYSNGMYVRLAFAVAAHLNPEIMVVDEVLAVGDTEFQKKCLGKMQDVAHSGRTVLFVSHNMHAISVLCNKAVFLRGGRLICAGDTQSVVDEYLTSFTQGEQEDQQPDRRSGTGEYRFVAVRPTREYFSPDEEKAIWFQIERRRGKLPQVYLAAHLFNSQGVEIAQFDSRLVGQWAKDREVTEGIVSFTTPWLKPGSYRIDLSIWEDDIVDRFEGACTLNVSPVLPYPNSAQHGPSGGMVFGDFNWRTYAPEEALPHAS